MNRYALLFFFFLAFNITAFAQQKQWGIGLRLGDPTGISVKKYLSRTRAFEFNLGRTGVWGHNYANAFYRYNKFDKYDYEYRQYHMHSAISLQGHLLFQQPIKSSDLKGLDWYYGFGGQLRSFAVEYQYRYHTGPNKNDWNTRWERVNDIDLGLDGILGLEYSWHEVPLSVFADVNLLIELADSPLHLFLQGGTGLRYYF